MPYSGGTGISTNPYLIANLSDIEQLKDDTNAGLTTNVYYKQVSDITLGTFEPIGYRSTSPFYYSFNGFYDGNYKILKNGTINYSGKDYIGIFAFSGQGNYNYIKNIIVNNIYVSGRDYIGVVCGRANGTYSNITTDSNCSVLATRNYSGGIFGYLSNGNAIKCKSSTNISGYDYSGGIIGYVGTGELYGCVLNCYNNGNIVSRRWVGGLVGYSNTVSSSRGHIYYSYNVGNLSGNENVGGIIGSGTFTSISTGVFNCYALNESITRLSGTATSFGRIAGITTNPGSSYLNNNYALDTMQFINVI
jgi:hypothetical protein